MFDEPEAGIDLWSFQNLIQVFERMRQKTQGSILIISHQERILNIADEIVVIADGKVINHGTRIDHAPDYGQQHQRWTHAVNFMRQHSDGRSKNHGRQVSRNGF